jgi:hypothetical protein
MWNLNYPGERAARNLIAAARREERQRRREAKVAERRATREAAEQPTSDERPNVRY